MQATIQRGNTSVTFDVIGEGGQPLIFFDAGKPNADEQRSGRADPRSSDFWSGILQISVRGELDRPTAHEDALTIAEELVKPFSGGGALEIDISDYPGETVYEVAPLESACILQYPPGNTDVVIVDLSMPVVDVTLGGTNDND